MQRAISLALGPDPNVVETIRVFNEVTNFFLGLGFENRTWSRPKLQQLGYAEARKKWPDLQCSLIQGARDCAADMLKREKCLRLPVKRPYTSARFNLRTFKTFLASGALSLSTVKGRVRLPLCIPTYFGRYLHGRVKSLRVRFDRGVLRAELVVELPDRAPPPLPPEPQVLGLDRGIVNIAVTSDGSFFNSRELRRVRGRYRYLRARLQAAGTRSARRHLRRLSGRERRFQADVSHRIAKQVASRPFDVLALEDLTIRRSARVGPGLNAKLGGWAYGQLASFLRYKCEDRGKRVVLVPPEFTSKLCSRCGEFGTRRESRFACRTCGFSLNADLNAARNIAHRGRSLVGRPPANGPIVARSEVGGNAPTDLGCKPPIAEGVVGHHKIRPPRS